MSESNYDFGGLNEHAIGIVGKAVIARTVREILLYRHNLVVEDKGDPKKGDKKTNADDAAQDRGVNTIQECTPNFGIVAEEDHFRTECAHPTHDIWWTLDGVDGTKALVRGESGGVASMLSLIYDGEIVMAWIGDALVNEVFGYRPGSPKTHYLYNDNHVRSLAIDEGHSLASQAVNMRDPIRTHSPFMQKILADRANGGLFKKFTFSIGSIGLSMSRIWKGIDGAAVLPEGIQYPWDLMPVVGICQHLGFVFLEVNGPLRKVTPRQIEIQKEAQYFDFETMVVHESRVDEFMQYVQRLQG
jgi:fructose-1,6-bisphosphatase/inositol monophosphatase family enzyme